MTNTKSFNEYPFNFIRRLDILFRAGKVKYGIHTTPDNQTKVIWLRINQ